jgi:spermidine/putrescine transport system ATP-binding protein
VNGALVQLATSGGWVVQAHRQGAITAGMAVEAFIRPEATLLACSAAELPAGQTAHTGEVISLLFDGANSAVLLRELQSRVEFRIALPQTGAYADLQAGARIYFSFDPQRAICFAAAAGHA